MSDNIAPSALTSGIRQIALVLGGWAVGKGYLDNDTLTAITTALVIIVPFAYGQYKNWKLHQEIKIAKAAPAELPQ